MIKLIGNRKVNVAVFISGTGSNLKNLIKYSLKNNSKYIIKLIVSNESNAKGLDHAKKFKIEKKIFNYQSVIKSEKDILDKLNKKKIEIICLAGFMKILSSSFIKKFKGKIINIHPSLLPKYKGLNTHQRVLNNNEKYSGCTVHYVNSKLDSGKIIIKKKVKIFKSDTTDKISKRILKQEHLIYPKALDLVISNL